MNAYQQLKGRKIQMFRGMAIIAVVMIHATPAGQWQSHIQYPGHSVGRHVIFGCTCATVLGKKFGRWVGLI